MVWIGAEHCKTVGSAYVGSNPTPATTCENGPLAAYSRLGGPFSSCPAVCHLVALWTGVSRCPRTHSGRRTTARTVGVHRRLSTDGHGRAASAACFRLDVRRRAGRTSPVCPPRLPGCFRGRGGREGGALMAEAAVRESVTVAGWAERARVARAFTAGVTRPGQPCGADAALLVSELFGSSVRHSGSGVPGETVTSGQGRGRHCPGGGHRPQRPPGCRSCVPLTGEAEGGRGLRWWRDWPRGGVAAAWRADGDLVRATARMTPASGGACACACPPLTWRCWRAIRGADVRRCVAAACRVSRCGKPGIAMAGTKVCYQPGGRRGALPQPPASAAIPPSFRCLSPTVAVQAEIHGVMVHIRGPTHIRHGRMARRTGAQAGNARAPWEVFGWRRCVRPGHGAGGGILDADDIQGPPVRRTGVHIFDRISGLNVLLRDEVKVPAGQVWGPPVPIGGTHECVRAALCLLLRPQARRCARRGAGGGLGGRARRCWVPRRRVRGRRADRLPRLRPAVQPGRPVDVHGGDLYHARAPTHPGARRLAARVRALRPPVRQRSPEPPTSGCGRAVRGSPIRRRPAPLGRADRHQHGRQRRHGRAARQHRRSPPAPGQPSCCSCRSSPPRPRPASPVPTRTASSTGCGPPGPRSGSPSHGPGSRLRCLPPRPSLVNGPWTPTCTSTQAASCALTRTRGAERASVGESILEAAQALRETA